MSDYWRRLDRDEDGRWIEDDVPNQREKAVATRKTKDETDQEKAVDQREIQLPDASGDSEQPSNDGSGDPHASDSDQLPAYTGIDGEAFPDKAEPIVSDQTETVTNDAGTEYEQPKFRAVHNPVTDSYGISLFGWVGPEAIVVPGADLDDFKAFVASL